jgi:hypothetical protein
MPGTRRIAVSGHRGLPAATADLVNKAIRAGLAECAPDVTGISCLADGADQIFARGYRSRRQARSDRPGRWVPGRVSGRDPTRI